MFNKLLNFILKTLRNEIFSISHIKKGNTILDVCCGDGNQLFYFAKKGVICFGIDINERLIHRAEKERKKRKHHNIFFQIADARKIPFSDEKFDYVLVSLGLHENKTPDIDKIVSEMKRVVKEDGYLIFVDFASPLPGNFISFLIKKIERFVGKENFENFNSYLKNGGLTSILRRNSLREGDRKTLMKGNIIIIKAGK